MRLNIVKMSQRGRLHIYPKLESRRKAKSRKSPFHILCLNIVYSREIKCVLLIIRHAISKDRSKWFSVKIVYFGKSESWQECLSIYNAFLHVFILKARFLLIPWLEVFFARICKKFISKFPRIFPHHILSVKLSCKYVSKRLYKLLCSSIYWVSSLRRNAY